MITIYSFSIKHGAAPKVAEVLDVRHLPNPHNSEVLRDLNGTMPEVWDYMLSRDKERTLLALEKGHRLAKSGKIVAFGCYGGKHRSVALAEKLVEMLTVEGLPAKAVHLALPKGGV